MSTRQRAHANLLTEIENATTYRSRIPPRWKHQDATVKFAKEHGRVFDTSDPGTGKTRGHLDVFKQRLDKGEVDRLVVVAPKSLMISAWQEDANTFIPGVPVGLSFAGTKRELPFLSNAPIVVINTDGVKWLASKTPGWFKKNLGPRSTLLIDESTAYKNYTSQRSRAIRKIKKHFEFRTLLTGTPITKSVTDIWHQALILDDGAALGTSFVKFRNEMQIPVPRGMFTDWQDREDAEELAGFMLKHMTIRHEFEKVMDIPPNHTRHVNFDVSKRIMKAYKDMLDYSILELRSGMVSAVQAAQLNSKLLQILSGCVYDDNGNPQLIDTSRYELAADLVNEAKHSLTFFLWSHQKEQMAKLLKARGVEFDTIDGKVKTTRRAEIVRDYQAGNLQTLLLQPQTGAHGLTLTKGTRTIWTVPVYQPDFLKQGLHRIYRGGQTKKTENILITALGTIEKRVYDIMSGRYERMTNLLEIFAE